MIINCVLCFKTHNPTEVATLLEILSQSCGLVMATQEYHFYITAVETRIGCHVTTVCQYGNSSFTAARQ